MIVGPRRRSSRESSTDSAEAGSPRSGRARGRRIEARRVAKQLCGRRRAERRPLCSPPPQVTGARQCDYLRAKATCSPPARRRDWRSGRRPRRDRRFLRRARSGRRRLLEEFFRAPSFALALATASAPSPRHPPQDYNRLLRRHGPHTGGGAAIRGPASAPRTCGLARTPQPIADDCAGAGLRFTVSLSGLMMTATALGSSSKLPLGIPKPSGPAASALGSARPARPLGAARRARRRRARVSSVGR